MGGLFCAFIRNIITNILILLIFSSPAYAQTRNITVTVKTPEGRAVVGYAGSYALLVGESNYTAGWPNLESVPGELAELETALKANGFEVTKVLDLDSKSLMAAFEKFRIDHGYDADNRLLFFFAGHGYSMDNGTRGFLVPVDAPDPHKDPKGFQQKSLDMTRIQSLAREISTKHVLFLFDSCFSGTIFKTRALPGVPPHISAATAKPVRQFITAGSAGEEVPARSVFVPSFIRGLGGEADFNRDGYVLGTELGMYLNQQVLDYQTGQTPQYGKIRDPNLDEGDFVFVAGLAPAGIVANETLSPGAMSVAETGKPDVAAKDGGCASFFVHEPENKDANIGKLAHYLRQQLQAENHASPSASAACYAIKWSDSRVGKTGPNKQGHYTYFIKASMEVREEKSQATIQVFNDEELVTMPGMDAAKALDVAASQLAVKFAQKLDAQHVRKQ